jgi:TonB family protein
MPALGIFEKNNMEIRVMSLLEGNSPISLRRATGSMLLFGFTLLSGVLVANAFTFRAADSAASETYKQDVPRSSSANSDDVDATYNPARIVPGASVSQPQVIYAPDPEYTDEARSAKYEGICVVALIVDAQGKPQHVRIVRPLGMGLDEKAVDAVKQYKFKPALYRGRAISTPIRIEVNFKNY